MHLLQLDKVIYSSQVMLRSCHDVHFGTQGEKGKGNVNC